MGNTAQKIANVATFGLAGGSALNASNRNRNQQQVAGNQFTPITGGPIAPPPPMPDWQPPAPKPPPGPLIAQAPIMPAAQFPFLPPDWSGWRR